MSRTIFVFVSSVLALISPFIYARAILRGEAKPHRTTRFVLLLVTILSTASLFAHHNTVAVWLAGVSTFQAIVISVLSIKRGMGGVAKIDLLCLVIALMGIVAWQTTQNPAVGLYFSILADFTGMVPTLIKTFHFPKTEIAAFFMLDTVASIFNLLATRTLATVDVAYPMYLFLINGLMSLLILWPRVSREA